jgi:hypothetical protein
VLLKRTVTVADDVGLDGEITVGWAGGVRSTVQVRLASLLCRSVGLLARTRNVWVPSARFR